MRDEILRSVDEHLRRGDTVGAIDSLIQVYTEQRDFAGLFEARRMKCRFEHGLSLADTEGGTEAYASALVQAARQTGEFALECGSIAAAWRYFRAIGDPAPVAAAIERAVPGDDNDELISIALQEGVHPAKGLELVLGQYGMCRAITAFGMNGSQKDRDRCISLLAGKLHAEVVASLARTVEAQEGTRPETTRLPELIAGRPWLFGQYDYYVDTSHLLSLLPYSVETTDDATLRVFDELCEYGKRLSSMFQFEGQPPFEEPFVDYGAYVKVLLGDDEQLQHFRRKLAKSDPQEYGSIPAQVLVTLLARRGRHEEALDIALEHLQDDDPSTLSCPSAMQLGAAANRYDRLRDNARQRGDVLSYIAATVMAGEP
jgi:hypothetical protein